MSNALIVFSDPGPKDSGFCFSACGFTNHDFNSEVSDKDDNLEERSISAEAIKALTQSYAEAAHW